MKMNENNEGIIFEVAYNYPVRCESCGNRWVVCAKRFPEVCGYCGGKLEFYPYKGDDSSMCTWCGDTGMMYTWSNDGHLYFDAPCFCKFGRKHLR